MNWNEHRVEPKQKVKLSEIATRAGEGSRNKNKLKAKLALDLKTVAKLQTRLFAENRQSLLIILQGMDSSGKDGTISKIMSGVNPQGVAVFSFKHPSVLELEHDYLWRHTQKLPEHGQIVVFNRSHYENLLISRVHPELVLAERLPDIDAPDKIDARFWTKRYQQIIDFEKNIRENGTHILKFFLHISKEEQARRFIERIENKEKHWKFSAGDLVERSHWPAYQKAYEQALGKTSTAAAPWYIVPADNKAYAHGLIGKVILETLKTMNPAFPQIDKAGKTSMQQARRKLEKELG